jgi:hypothetical protein
MTRWGQILGGPKVWVRDVVFTAAVALTISFMGPYGSYDRPLQDRVVTSFAFGFAGSLWLWPVMRAVLRAGVRAGLPELFTMAAGLTLLAAPVAAISTAISRLLHPELPRNAPLDIYFAVLAMVLPIGAGYLLVDRAMAQPELRAAEEPAEPPPPRLLDRLPKRLGAEVFALQAEDHYVRVHTALGSDLLLMRFADAVAEAEGIDGLRVHRSWWVARDAVAAARAEGRRATLSLKTGLAVPVTRECVPEIRKAGWL